MARTPYDTYAKDLTVALLSPYGAVESDARVMSEPQFADVRFVLDPDRTRAPWDFLTRDLTDRLMIEFAHDPPDLAEMTTWTSKRDAWWRALIRAARRRKQEPPRLPPRLLGLSAGDPVEARQAMWMRPIDGSPGCYEGPPAGTYRLVVISALPRTRETLLVRTMGAGETLREALAELTALSPDAPERTLAAPFVVRLRIDLQHDPSPDAKETLMQAQKLYEQLIERSVRKGRREAAKEYAGLMKKQLEQGLEQGLSGLRTAIEQVCTTRGLKLTSSQRAKLAAETDMNVLLQWHAKAITAARAREIFA